MSYPTTGPLSGSTEVHARIAAALAVHADLQFKLKQPSRIHAYVRRHLPEHAAAGESMNEDIISRPILSYLDITTLKRTPSSADLPLMPLVGMVAHAWTWEHPERNAAALRFIAAAERYYVGSRDLPTPWDVSWAKSPGPSEILARIGSFVSLGAARLDGRIVVAMAAQRDRLELWDLASGRPVQLRPPPDNVTALAIGPGPDDGVLVCVGTQGGLVCCWLIRRTGPRRKEWPEPEDWGYFDVGNEITALCVTAILDRPHILAGQADGSVTLVDCADGSLRSRRIHQGRVTGVTSIRLGNGAPAAVSVGVDGFVVLSHLGLWPTSIGAGLHGEEAIRAAAAMGLAGDQAVALTVGDNGSVRVWDLPPESPRFRMVPGHDQNITAVAAGTGPRDEPLVITGDIQGRLRVVDPHEAKVVGGPVEGHGDRVTGLALERATDGRAIAVSGGADGIVRSWNLAGLLGNAPQDVAQAGASHPRQRPIRVWRLDDGRELGGEVGAHSHRMTAAAVGWLADGIPIAVTDGGSASREAADSAAIIGVGTAALPDGGCAVVSASTDSHLRFWDLVPCPDLPPRASQTAQATSHSGVRAVASVRRGDGVPVAVSAGRDHVLKVWDMRSGRQLGSDLTGHERTVTALTVAAPLGGRTAVVSGSEDASLRAWDVDVGRQIGRTFRGYQRRVTALAATWVGDSLIAVTACRRDAVVRWCDLLAAVPRSRELIGHSGSVTAVAILPDPERPLAVTADEDHAIRIWDLMASAPLRVQGRDLDPMPVPGAVRAIACFDDGRPGAVIAGDDVLAVVRWDGLDQKARGRYEPAPSAVTRSWATDGPRVAVADSRGVVIGSHNVQINHFNNYYANQPPQPEEGSGLPDPDSGQQ